MDEHESGHESGEAQDQAPDDGLESRMGTDASLETAPPDIPTIEMLPVLDAGAEESPHHALADGEELLADVLHEFGAGHNVRHLKTGEVAGCTDIDRAAGTIRTFKSTAWLPADEWVALPGWRHVPEEPTEPEAA